MFRLEFTIEPFVEGAPGPHVLAAIDAVTSRGIEVEMGPFGSSCIVAAPDVGDVVGRLTDAAVSHGASHVSLHTERAEP